MLIVEVLEPDAEGSKVTVNVVELLAAMVAGKVIPPTANSVGFELVIPPLGIVKFPVSVFSMVNVRTTVPELTFAGPKSRWSLLV